jgi:NADH dehydrogenase (ubiquinone) 1 alpha subcomplex subunit 9
LCRNFTYDDVHVDGVERIAEAVAKYDVDRFIHVSSYNADTKSPSEFFRSKVIYPEICVQLERQLRTQIGPGREGC